MTEGDQKSKDEAFGLVAGPNTPEGRRTAWTAWTAWSGWCNQPNVPVSTCLKRSAFKVSSCSESVEFKGFVWPGWALSFNGL